MKGITRRTLLRTGSGFILTDLLAAGDDAVRPEGTIRLYHDSSQLLQHFHATEDHLYFLTIDRNTGGNTFWQCDLGGNATTSYPLPVDARYGYFSPRDSGTTVFFRMLKAPAHGRSLFGFEERTAAGALMRTLDERLITGMNPYCLVGEWIVALRNDGTLEGVNMNDEQSSWTRLSDAVISLRDPGLVTGQDSNLVIVDVTSGKGAAFDVGSRQVTSINLSSPEIEFAKAYYSKRAAELPDGAERLFVVFGAMAVVGNGNLYSAVFPCDPKIGLYVVGFDAGGAYRSSTLLQFPMGRKGPSYLAFPDGTLSLIFADGEMVKYGVSVV